MGAHIHYHDVNYLQLFVSKTRFGYYYALYISNYNRIDSFNKYVYNYPFYVIFQVMLFYFTLIVII